MDYRIVVDVDGIEVVGIRVGERHLFMSDDSAYASRATSAANRQVKNVAVIPSMPYRSFTAGWDTPLAMTAAIFSIDPGRSIIREAPDELTDELDQITGIESHGMQL